MAGLLATVAINAGHYKTISSGCTVYCLLYNSPAQHVQSYLSLPVTPLTLKKSRTVPFSRNNTYAVEYEPAN